MAKSRHQAWALRAGVAGVTLFEAGFAATIARWHDLCLSGLVQLSPLSSAHAAGECALVAGAYHATGWLIGTGRRLAAFRCVRSKGRCRAGRRLHVPGE
jgi:hypothetical protein